MKNKRGNILVIFLAVALIVLIVAACYLFAQNRQLQNQKIQPILPVQNSAPTLAPTINPTVNWKTYTDNTNKFSFRYPTTFQEEVSSDAVTVIKDDYILRVYTNWHGTGALPSGQPVSFSESKVKVGNSEYSKATTWISSGKLLSPEQIIIDRGTNTFAVSLYYKNNLWDKNYSDLFDQILSTFKFL